MSKNEYNVSIPENLAKDQTVLWVHASDADEVRLNECCINCCQKVCKSCLYKYIEKI